MMICSRSYIHINIDKYMSYLLPTYYLVQIAVTAPPPAPCEQVGCPVSAVPASDITIRYNVTTTATPLRRTRSLSLSHHLPPSIVSQN